MRACAAAVRRSRMTVNRMPTSLQLLGVVLQAFDMTRQSYAPAYEILNGRKARRARMGLRVAHACDQWAAAAALLFGVPASSCTNHPPGHRPVASKAPLVMRPPVAIAPQWLGTSLHLHGIAWDRAREAIRSDPSLELAFFRYAVVHTASVAALWGWSDRDVFRQILTRSPIQSALATARGKAPTQLRLAVRLGVSEETVRRWKVGDSCPTSEHIEALAELADLETEDLHRRVGLWRLAEHLRRAVGEVEFDSGVRVFTEVRQCRAAHPGTTDTRIHQLLWEHVVPLWTWFVPEELLPHEARTHGGPAWEIDVRRVQTILREGARANDFGEFEFVADLHRIHLQHVPKNQRVAGLPSRTRTTASGPIGPTRAGNGTPSLSRARSGRP